jgi:hypothetical protein
MTDAHEPEKDPSTDFVPPVVLKKGPRLYPIGSATYIIGGHPTSMMLTARHLFDEMERIDGGPSRSHASIPQIFRPAPTPSRVLRRSFMHAIREVDGAGFLRSIKEAKASDGHDLAIAALYEDGFLRPPPSVRIDTSIPVVGTTVWAVGWSMMEPLNVEEEGSSIRFTFSWERSVRRGKITAVHPEGLRMYHWPCFETDMTFASGMSGGPIFDERSPLVAIGVISSGWDEGGSVGAMLWPLGGLAIRRMKGGVDQTSTVVELIEEGVIKDLGELHKRWPVT